MQGCQSFCGNNFEWRFMAISDDTYQPKFCSDCGLSLVMLDTWHTSRNCGECGKKIYFVRPDENGGIKIEKGENFHVPPITLSLDPKIGGIFFRPGLEMFIKQLFLEEQISSDELIEKYKEIETRIDNELRSLDFISHCDLDNEAGTHEAMKILEAEGLTEYRDKLIRSCCLRACYSSIENGDSLQAAYASHQAALFKEYSLLEHHHLKEIIWLGYSCYVDLCRNEGLTPEAAKEQRLIKGALPKITSTDAEILYTIANDGNNIGIRLGISGISENTLKSLLQYEIDGRSKNKEDDFKNREIAIKEKDNQIKIWGTIFTLANIIIFGLYKVWLC
jgi:ribosomal protein S27AE